MRERFDGEIFGAGSASGVRVVIGAWASSPFGTFADAMVEDVAGERTLVAPSDAIAEYVSATYTFDRVAVTSVGAHNDYGHMHQQAKRLYEKAGIPWYRTDQNGTITIQSPGTPGSGYAIVPSRGIQNLAGPSDRTSRQGACNAK